MSLLTGRLPDNRKLRHVIGVARAGSFTGATKLLAISQSALTKSVAEVEAQLGYPLFERLPRGVRPTAAGQSSRLTGSSRSATRPTSPSPADRLSLPTCAGADCASASRLRHS